MTLREYTRKRRFDRTREPDAGRASATTAQNSAGRPIFVVQLHHASHRHYDFRLQVGDVLRSWAVPKGPSLDPKVKRLAAEVEDHPVRYAEFEGLIPAGEYGGGHVARFDAGIWSTDGDPVAQLAKGHLRFELFGDKLKGAWHLIRSGRPSRKPQWLLIKVDDRHARQAEADDLLDDVTPPPGAMPVKTTAAGTTSTKTTTAKTTTAKAAAGKKSTAKTGTAESARAKATAACAPGAWAKRAMALPGAIARALPATPPPRQLATPVPAPPQGAGWLHELKWDGYRILAMIDQRAVRLWSRNDIEWTAKLPDIVDALSQLGLRDGVIDGELIAGRGLRADFPLLQSTLSGDRNAPLVYVVFDLLQLDGVSLAGAPLRARKALLAAVLDAVPGGGHLAMSTHSEGDGAAAFDAAVGAGFEGVVSKRADAAHAGGRGGDWRKAKAQDAEEFAVVGYTPPKGSRGGFGALLLARREGRGWVYAGRVGSGFSDAQLKDLRRRIGSAGAPTPGVRVPDNDTDLRHALWFAPRFVVEVASRGTGGNGLLRQPSLKAIRLDKTIADLPSGTRASRARAVGARQDTAAMPKAGHARVDTRVSSPDKVLFPADGITKQDVADYYAAVMPRLLPELVDRPLSVVRCPGGVDGACFFQKHLAAGIEGVDRVAIEEKDGGREDYLVVRDAAAVMALVQSNAIEFHPWGARADDPDRADRLVFDLDPGPGVAWNAVRAAARLIRDLLAGMDIACYLRTSGGKGLHVVVPLHPAVDWGIAKPFAHAFAESMARLHPERFVATASKALRTGRIFVDYLRNGRGATSVASYSLRARPGAPVAMPITWDELGRVRCGDAFRLGPALLRRIATRPDPWAGIDAVTQRLPGAGQRGPSPDTAPRPRGRAGTGRAGTSAGLPGATAPSARVAARQGAAKPPAGTKAVARTSDTASTVVARKAAANAAAKKAAVKSTAAAKRPAAKKSVTKKSAAKKIAVAAKKAAVAKNAVRTRAGKTPAAKKTAASAAKKAVVKTSAATKQRAAKTPASRKVAAKKSAAKKTATAAAKNAAVGKSAVGKTPAAKKTAASSAKKALVKTSAATKQRAAKTPAAKTPASRKVAAKKSAARKTATAAAKNAAVGKSAATKTLAVKTSANAAAKQAARKIARTPAR